MFSVRLATIGLMLAAWVISDSRPLVCQSAVSLPQDRPLVEVAVPRADGQASAGVNRVEALLQGVRTASFPELSHTDIRVRQFHSKSDYFRTRFSLARYASLQKMHFYLEVNPGVFELGAPEEGIRAIIAHELEHVLYISRRSRIGMLSLVRLASGDYTARFERRADLGAIGLGYGSGLILYRQWLYQNIPAEAVRKKRRDYFSPEEIAEIQSIIQKRPKTLWYWLKHVPLSIEDINKQGIRQGLIDSRLETEMRLPEI
jgi:hypothetical protein